MKNENPWTGEGTLFAANANADADVNANASCKILDVRSQILDTLLMGGRGTSTMDGKVLSRLWQSWYQVGRTKMKKKRFDNTADNGSVSIGQG